MKKIIIILAFLIGLTCGLSHSKITMPTIDRARLDQIIIKRDLDNPSILGDVLFYGQFIDENGVQIVTDKAPFKSVKWKSLKQAWKDAMYPVLKEMSKQFNNEFANENIETF